MYLTKDMNKSRIFIKMKFKFYYINSTLYNMYKYL